MIQEIRSSFRAAVSAQHLFMLATPDVSHLSKADFLRVYEPAEDSFCFLDALEQDQERLRQACPRLVVEIG